MYFLDWRWRMNQVRVQGTSPSLVTSPPILLAEIAGRFEEDFRMVIEPALLVNGAFAATPLSRNEASPIRLRLSVWKWLIVLSGFRISTINFAIHPAAMGWIDDWEHRISKCKKVTICGKHQIRHDQLWCLKMRDNLHFTWKRFSLVVMFS